MHSSGISFVHDIDRKFRSAPRLHDTVEICISAHNNNRPAPRIMLVFDLKPERSENLPVRIFPPFRPGGVGICLFVSGILCCVLSILFRRVMSCAGQSFDCVCRETSATTAELLRDALFFRRKHRPQHPATKS